MHHSSAHDHCIVSASSVHHQGIMTTFSSSEQPLAKVDIAWERKLSVFCCHQVYWLKMRMMIVRMVGVYDRISCQRVSLLNFSDRKFTQPLWLWPAPVDQELHQIQGNSLPFLECLLGPWCGNSTGIWIVCEKTMTMMNILWCSMYTITFGVIINIIIHWHTSTWSISLSIWL